MRFGAMTAASVRWSESEVQAEDGYRIPLRIYDGPRAGLATLVWAHGGSWTRGSLEDWHAACLALTSLCGLRIVNVGYRLAPRWTHPTALNDLLRVVRWASAHLTDPASQLVIGGDSAGGTIAAGAALWCRDHGIPLAGQILAYPPLDPECTAPSYLAMPARFPERRQLQQAWARYRGPLADRMGESYLTPLNGSDLSGLCRTALITGTFDPVSDDVRSYAANLQRDGVPALLHIDPALEHGDFLFQRGPRPNPVHVWINTVLDTWFDTTHDHNRMRTPR
ncbi:alpha/beta hydrolase fold domain-containing protein [Cryobacterium sp. N19]|uniref:alpha/beta hydrolase fold domain-containing protein n=1 Tax=Cryobacterium sp. N19 TaxID=2048288 RepID=UPI000CE34109|nr:alpha/beta hydrolase fold domain-containing protein [Cryobacterium sp. N19]